MLDIFTDNWDELPNLNEGETLVRIVTDNSYDELYAIISEDMDADDEIRRALRHKFGAAVEYGGYEDQSFLYEMRERAKADATEAWDGEGHYAIGWSDGGPYWTSNGPVWCDTEDELAAEILAAYGNATETHLPCAERVAVLG